VENTSENNTRFIQKDLSAPLMPRIRFKRHSKKQNLQAAFAHVKGN
jgi:hypothetical protein